MSNKVHCAHILIEKHSEALQVLNRLGKGENFSAVAKEVSICSSKKRGVISDGLTEVKWLRNLKRLRLP
jgi:parvulin-like peptidyl-prolyl isomerase